MIRRLGVLFVSVLILAGCAGAERDAVTVGDRSLSREDLIGFTRLNNDLAEGVVESEAVVDAESLRASAQLVIEQYAQIEALEGVGVVSTPEQREDAGRQLRQIIDRQKSLAAENGRPPLSDFVAGYSSSSAGYDFVIDLLSIEGMVNANPDLVPLVRTEDVSAAFTSASVESRLGIWDPTQGLVLRPSGLSDAEAEIAEQEIELARVLAD